MIDGRIRSLDHEQAGVEPTLGAARPPEHPQHRWLRCSRPGCRPGRASPEAGRASTRPRTSTDGAFRRLAQKVDLELLARACARRLPRARPGDFDCSAMDWFIERARALGVEHRPPAPLLLGRHLLALGLAPGPRSAKSSGRSTKNSSTARSRPSRQASKKHGGSAHCSNRAIPLMYFA